MSSVTELQTAGPPLLSLPGGQKGLNLRFFPSSRRGPYYVTFPPPVLFYLINQLRLVGPAPHLPLVVDVGII